MIIGGIKTVKTAANRIKAINEVRRQSRGRTELPLTLLPGHHSLPSRTQSGKNSDSALGLCLAHVPLLLLLASHSDSGCYVHSHLY